MVEKELFSWSDELFREVDEEVRQDRFQELWKRYGTYAVIAVVLIVGTTVAVVVWRDMQESARMADSERFLAAVVQEQTAREGAIDQLRALAQDGTPGYRFLASLREASLVAQSGDATGAVSIFDAAAAAPDISDTYRDVANILAVAHGMDVLSDAEVEQRLGSMNAPDHPFRFNRAGVSRRSGPFASVPPRERRNLLRTNIEDPDTPLATRARASELLALVGN